MHDAVSLVLGTALTVTTNVRGVLIEVEKLDKLVEFTLSTLGPPSAQATPPYLAHGMDIQSLCSHCSLSGHPNHLVPALFSTA